MNTLKTTKVCMREVGLPYILTHIPTTDTGGANFKNATDFLKSRFLSLNHSKLLVYPHLTCATDTKQIELVFAAVKETILAKALKMTGIM